MKIFWPGMIELPRCSYEVLSTLHGCSDLLVKWTKAVRWQDIDGLAEYLKLHEKKEGWVYTIQHMMQVEQAAKTCIPFRVLDFFHPTPQGPVELAGVMQVEGTERQFLWTNPFFKRDNVRLPVSYGLNVH